MTLTDNLVANGNIVVSSVQTNNVLGGLVFDQSTRRLNLSYLTWTFEVEGGVMMPLGKPGSNSHFNSNTDLRHMMGR